MGGLLRKILIVKKLIMDPHKLYTWGVTEVVLTDASPKLTFRTGMLMAL